MHEGLKDSRIELTCKGCYESSSDKDGSFTGWCSKTKNSCGCLLASKVRVEEEVCPQGIWSNDSINLDRLDELNKENNFTPSKEYRAMREKLNK